MKLEDIPTVEELSKLSEITDDRVMLIPDIVKVKEEPTETFSTGIPSLDNVHKGGFNSGNLVIITGISGQGKTTLAQTLTYNFCQKGIPCLWFSYEVCLEDLDEKFQDMGMNNFYYAYSPKQNTTGKLDWIKFKINESLIKYGTKIVFIDHLDFLTPDGVKTSDNEAIQFKKIVMQLKTLAVNKKIVIVTMAHLKKLPEGKEPEMQDIGYSAGIYQNADLVLIITREQEKRNYLNNTGSIYKNTSIMKLVKNRKYGKNFFTRLTYQDNKFSELTEIYEEPTGYQYQRTYDFN